MNNIQYLNLKGGMERGDRGEGGGGGKKGTEGERRHKR
jgi:hypothetical protein